MRIFVTDISRDVIKAYADGVIQEIGASNKYNISFTIESNGTFMDTDVDVIWKGHMTFDIARELVEDKLGIQGG